MAYFNYYQAQYPGWGQQQYANQYANQAFVAPPVPSYQPQPSWTGQDYYTAHYGGTGGAYENDVYVFFFFLLLPSLSLSDASWAICACRLLRSIWRWLDGWLAPASLAIFRSIPLSDTESVALSCGLLSHWFTHTCLLSIHPSPVACSTMSGAVSKTSWASVPSGTLRHATGTTVSTEAS